MSKQPAVVNQTLQSNENAKKLEEIRGQLNLRLESLASNDPTYQRLMGRLDVLIEQEKENVGTTEAPSTGRTNLKSDNS
jgi:hypothetical protein